MNLNQINDLNKIEKLNIDNRIMKKFKESCCHNGYKKYEDLKLNYYGIKKNKAGKPFLIKIKYISLSHTHTPMLLV